MELSQEIQYIRGLAEETNEYAHSDLMQKRRKDWTAHNSLHFTHPLVYVRAIPFDEFMPESEYKCTSHLLRKLEREFLLNRYRMQLDDDYIIEPYYLMRAEFPKGQKEAPFGLPISLSEKVQVGGSSAYKPTLLEEEDTRKLFVPDYGIDEEKTRENYIQLKEILGDSLPVCVDYKPLLCDMGLMDVCCPLAKMRGLEQLLWDVYDFPEWLEQVVGWMTEQVLRQIDQCASAGKFLKISHQNQAMPYSEELGGPENDGVSVQPSELWAFSSAQEMTMFGPEMFEQFMFRYQQKVLERFGLVAYGCCENITQKIPVIKQLKNLRRIAVSPFSDTRSCAEQIGDEYVLSWRPNPSSAVSFGIDEDYVRKELRETFSIMDENHCVFDITLKDVETVSGKRDTIIRWSKVVREEILRHYG